MRVRVVRTVYLACFLTWSAVSENSCSLDQVCSASFVYFRSLQLIGCPTAGSSGLSRPLVPLYCLGNLQCAALICDAPMKTCSPCPKDVIASLGFASTSGVYLKRRLVRSDIPYDPVTLFTDDTSVIPDGLVPGDVIYLRATVLKYDNFFVNLLVNDSVVNYHVRASCDHSCYNFYNCTASNCASRYTIMSYYTSGKWNDWPKNYAYPFTLGQSFEVHIIVMPKAILCYVNKYLYPSFPTPLSAQSVRSIQVKGNMQVHELSL